MLNVAIFSLDLHCIRSKEDNNLARYQEHIKIFTRFEYYKLIKQCNQKKLRLKKNSFVWFVSRSFTNQSRRTAATLSAKTASTSKNPPH